MRQTMDAYGFSVICGKLMAIVKQSHACFNTYPNNNVMVLSVWLTLDV